MHHKHRPNSRVARSTLRVPPIRRCEWTLGVLIVLFVAATLWAGSLDPVKKNWGSGIRAWPPIDWVLGQVATIFDGFTGLIIGSVSRGTAHITVPSSARFAFFTLVLLLIIVLHKWMLSRNAFKPGPVDVSELIDATQIDATQGEIDKPAVKDLTAYLRLRLSKTDLYPPSTLSVDAPPENFLDLVGDVDPDPKKVWTSLMRLLGRMRPRTAYRVSGVLVTRKPEPCYGITVTVTAYSLGGSRMFTVWADSWVQAVRDASCWAMETILPVTRFGKKPPWSGWRGRQMPRQLLAHYQEAKRLTEELRLDEALKHYYQALELDPLNPYLRFEVAGVQERLGLYIDALDTLRCALTMDGQTDDEYNRRLWESFWRLQCFHYLRYLWRRPDAIEVRYKYAVVLSYGKKIASQWCKEDTNHDNVPRKQARDSIKKRLTPVLVDRYWPLATSESGSRALRRLPEDKKEKARSTVQEMLDGKGKEREIQVFLQQASMREIYRLAADRRLTWLAPSARPTCTGTTLRLSRDLLAPLRLEWARSLNNGAASCTDAVNGWGSILNRRKGSLSWEKITVDYLEEGVKRAMWSRLRRVWPRDPEWQNHYNAACVYAVAMHKFDDGEQNKKCDELGKFAKAAVQELKEAVHNADSGYITERRWWILSSDPDLAALRPNRLFRAFEEDTYPGIVKTKRRIEEPQFEMTNYDLAIVVGGAGVMERTWYRRGRGCYDYSDIHTVKHWIRADEDIWKCLGQMARNRARHWPDRSKFIEAVRNGADPVYGDETFFHPNLLAFSDHDVDDAQLYYECVDEMLKHLSALTCHPCQYSQDLLKKMDGASFLGNLSEICNQYAAVWQKLDDWFAKEPTHRSGNEKAAFETFVKGLV